MKLLILDIETFPILSYHWGLWDQNIAINQIREPGGVLCWAAKWHGKDRMFFRSLKHHGHEKMLAGIYDLLESADSVIHYNGMKFDIPILNTEFAHAKMPPPAPFSQIDLLRVVRQQFRLPSNKLDYVAQFLGLGEKISHEGFSLWKDCMAGKASAWKIMKAYNIRDAVLTEGVYDYLLPWIRFHPNYGLLANDDGPVCTNCGSGELQRRGVARTKTMEYQRFQCNGCGTWSRARLAEKRDRKHVLTGVT